MDSSLAATWSKKYARLRNVPSISTASAVQARAWQQKQVRGWHSKTEVLCSKPLNTRDLMAAVLTVLTTWHKAGRRDSQTVRFAGHKKNNQEHAIAVVGTVRMIIILIRAALTLILVILKITVILMMVMMLITVRNTTVIC